MSEIEQIKNAIKKHCEHCKRQHNGPRCEREIDCALHPWKPESTPRPDWTFKK